MRSLKSRWPDSVVRLTQAGITTDDAYELRRIAMTLHRWHEMECGDSNEYCSYVLVRGHKGDKTLGFVHDDDGKPYLEMHRRSENHTRYEPIADRERGALKRLAAIMARYPGFAYYVQGDPRGAALYVIPADVVGQHPVNQPVDDYYSRGIAVYK